MEVGVRPRISLRDCTPSVLFKSLTGTGLLLAPPTLNLSQRLSAISTGGDDRAMKILIVEDSPLVQKMYGLVFSKREHVMTTALNGRDALQLINDSTAPYDLILLDLRMPDMDGVEFIEALRKSGHEFDSIPIVLTTAEPEESSLLQHARAMGVSAVVRKPWRPNELREVIRQVIPERIG